MSIPIPLMPLARKDGVERTYIDIELTSDGLEISGQDLGPAVRAFHGDGDYEYGIKITNADLPHFAYALIMEHYQGDCESVRKLRELATKYGIDSSFWDWA